MQPCACVGRTLDKCFHMISELTTGKNRAAENLAPLSMICSIGQLPRYIISMRTRSLNRASSEPKDTRNLVSPWRIRGKGTDHAEMASIIRLVPGAASTGLTFFKRYYNF